MKERLGEIKDSDTLKACPFCGGDSVWLGSDSPGHEIHCRDCHATLRFCLTPDSAIAAWNNCPIETELIAMVESLLIVMPEKPSVERVTIPLPYINREEAKEYALKALSELTPRGSEFFEAPVACVNFIRRTRDNLRVQLKKEILWRKKTRALLEEIRNFLATSQQTPDGMETHRAESEGIDHLLSGVVEALWGE